MNHSSTLDRLENDGLADYPYKRDHRGYNNYKTHVGPDAALTLGRQTWPTAGDGRRRPGMRWAHGRTEHLGRLRIFEYAALTKDSIADDLILWEQPVGSPGRMRAVPDRRPSQNTWEHELYADLNQRIGPGIQLQHRIKWSLRSQRDDAETLHQREGRRTSYFTGLVNRAQWSIPIGWQRYSRAKSEYRRERPQHAAKSLQRAPGDVYPAVDAALMAESVGVSYFPRYGDSSLTPS